jgi:hypothetical protein
VRNQERGHDVRRPEADRVQRPHHQLQSNRSRRARPSSSPSPTSGPPRAGRDGGQERGTHVRPQRRGRPQRRHGNR